MKKKPKPKRKVLWVKGYGPVRVRKSDPKAERQEAIRKSRKGRLKP